MCLVPNATEQTTDRSRRGTLVILLLVAAVGVGLWFALERPKLAEPASTAKPTTGDAQTTVSGATSTAGDTQTTASGADSTADGAQTTASGADSTTDGAQTTASGADSTADGAQTAASDDGSTADGAQTAASDDGSTADGAQTAASDDGSTADGAQTTASGADSTADGAQTTASGADSTADGAQTTASGDGSTADGVQTTASGDGSTTDGAQTTASGADSTADGTQTTASGADSTADGAQTTASGDGSTADGAQTTASGADSTADGAQTTASGNGSTADGAQTTASGDGSTAGELLAAGTGTVASQDPARPVDPDATGDATRIAAVEPGTAAVDEGPRVSAAPDSAVEKTPVDAPPDGEATGEVGILAAVGDAIKRLETAIEERLDSELEVSVTYDDSQADAPKPETTPTEAVRTTESDATLTPGGTQAPDSDVGDDTSVAGTPGSGGAAPDATMADDTTATDATVAADTTATDATVAADTTATDATVAGDTTATDDTVAADTTATDDTVAADATATADAGSADTEAKKYVETLTETAPQTIPVDKADHFVTPERVISLVPEDTIENVSVDDLAGDETLSPDTPITVVREVEQVEDAVAEQLIADSGGDLDKELRVQVTYDDSQEETGTGVVGEDDVQKITVREALERIRTEPDRPLPVIRTVRYFQVVTLKELLDGAVDEDAFLSVVTRPYRIESATLADLLERQKAENPDSIFYLHTVLPTDDQGIWGIVHFGIIDNFARGMAIRRGEDIETYTVRIPRHADERLADRSSSFLGLMIDRKTKESYVYNFRDNRMGRNPDRIFPGQELVIISFQPEELMAIYTHFAAS